MTPEEKRLAEALAVERIHGDKAVEFIASPVRELALVGDEAGVERWREIAAAYDFLNPPSPLVQ
ncbi:DUF6961 family protein [Sphingomonas sp. S2-65]|uniref:DUF6961 family protein n=1 Tax=Sphingomonas sp. S2-65 TaxID=2903960 RepID=UPI001F41C49E|nr:hypothetical protein [Sphingomonas sp. S2-65]UYY57101.1 hypothetical protein LZ586_10415 [Sphingomonas sp. S2-65]